MALYMAIFDYNSVTNEVDFFKDENQLKVSLRNIIRNYYDDCDEFDEAVDGADSIHDYMEILDDIDSDMYVTWGNVPSTCNVSQIEDDVLNRFIEEANQWPDNRDEEPLVESFPGYTPILTVGDIRKIAKLKPKT